MRPTDLCKRHKVSIDGQPVKPSRDVSVGQVVIVRKEGLSWQYRVLRCIDQRVGAQLVKNCCEDITPKEEKDKLALIKGGWVPRRAKGLGYRCLVFEGKQDLERRLVQRMRGYRVPNAKFIVLRDQDASDCKVIKKMLVQKCCEARHPDAVVRIACYELESWYLADLAAVERGLGLSNLVKHQKERQFSSPDIYPSPSQTLKKIAPSYQKVSGSRALGVFLDPSNTCSSSFEAFITGLNKLCNG